MRKLVVLILLICTCTVSVSAAQAQYAVAGELYEAWCDDLPDYICGVWSTDGGLANLTFGIQNTEEGNAGKQQMLELIANDSSVTFVYQKFSRNYLLGLQEEIDGYFERDMGLVSTGLDDLNNCIVLGILEERKDDAYTQSMIAEIMEKYGEAVSVEYTTAPVAVSLEVEGTSYLWLSPQAQPMLFFPVAVMLLLFGVGLAVAIRRKKLLLQSGNGAAVSMAPLSSREVENMVKQSVHGVPSDLKQRVMKSIEEDKE